MLDIISVPLSYPAPAWENIFFTIFAVTFMLVGCFTCWMATQFANESEEEKLDGSSFKQHGWVPVSWVVTTGVAGVGFMTFVIFASETVHTVL